MKIISIFGIIILILLIIWILATHLVVRNIEEPKYTIIEINEWYEIRKYDNYIVAEVEVKWTQNEALNNWFKLLAGYIFWWNTKNISISMTAPVSEITQKSEQIAMTVPVSNTITDNNLRIVQFSMPSKYSLEDLPNPNNKQVKIKKIEWYKSAVLQYSWYANEKRVNKMKENLLSYLNKDGIEVNWNMVSAQYNPPFSFPLLRRNEIMIPIK